MAKDERRGLGRGLAALISDVGDESTGIDRARGGQQQRRAPVDQLFASPRNPRRRFAEDDLDELVASVKERGVVQPILVRSVSNGFEIIAGERRWRAAGRAGVHDVPIVVLEVTEREALEIAIVENVQRADLNALEEAAGYDQLIEEFKYRQEDLAKVIGKSRSHIANTLRLMKLPEMVKNYVREGQLSAGHARALLGSENPEALAAKVVKDGLSVRETEALVRDEGAKTIAKEIKAADALDTKNADARALEKSLGEATGLKIRISAKGEAGELKISYASLEQLDEIARRLRH